VLLEQFELGHDRGSSHGTSRIFRLSYPDAAYTELARQAHESWRRLEQERGTTLVEHTGSIDLGDATAEIERSLTANEVPYEMLDGASAARRWPLSTDVDEPVVFQPLGGYIRADRAFGSLLESARAASGDVIEQARVVQIEVTGSGVRVATAATELHASAVVVAAGAWASGLLVPLGIDLPVVVTRETVAYFEHPDVEALPAVIEYPSAASALPVGQAYYALPAPGRGLKAGVHHSGPATDADEPGVRDERVVAATAAWVARRFRDADPAPVAAETCLYTNTADESFVIEAHGRVVVASACSGHGFKFAPLLGERIAALAVNAA